MPEPACTRSELRLLIIWRMIWSEFFVEGLSLFIVALCNTADRYIFALWFVSSIFFSSPNLSGRRLDVYHTSTDGGTQCFFSRPFYFSHSYYIVD